VHVWPVLCAPRAGGQALALKYGYRPHWGKQFYVGRDHFRAVYPKFDDFVTLRRELDPAGRFLNPFLSFLE
jgi:FAD/FMN-containing dehydrogenase